MDSNVSTFLNWSVTFIATGRDKPYVLGPIPAPTRDAAIFLATCELCHFRAYHHSEWARQTKDNWVLESVTMIDAHCCSCDSAGKCSICGKDHHGSNCADGNHTESCTRVYDHRHEENNRIARDEEQAIMEAQDERKAGIGTYQGTRVKLDAEGLPVHPLDQSLCDFDEQGQCVDCGQSAKTPFVIRSASGLFWNGAGWSAEYPDAVTYPSVQAARKTLLRLRREEHVVTVIGNYGLDSQMEVNV